MTDTHEQEQDVFPSIHDDISLIVEAFVYGLLFIAVLWGLALISARSMIGL